MYRGNEFRARLRRGEALYGLLHGLASPIAAEMAALAGYDVVIIDDEHGATGRTSHLHLAQAIKAGGAGCFMRVSSQDPLGIGQALDLGVDGLIVPGVHNAAQAAEVVRATRYPPNGSRGYGLSLARAAGFGLQTPTYRRQIEEGMFLALIVESAQGVADAEAIANTPGVDAVVAGMHDLSTDLGLEGELTHPTMRDAMARIEAATRAAGKTMGSAIHGDADAQLLYDRGHRFITMGSDTRLLGEAMAKRLARCPR